MENVNVICRNLFYERRKKIETYIAHISHMSHGALHTYENEIGRQLMKAPQAAAIVPLLISSHPPHP